MRFDVMWKKSFVYGIMALFLASAVVPASLADETRYRRVYDSQTQQYYFVPEDSIKDKAVSALRTPVIKQAAIGAGVGAAAGLLSDRTSVLRGATIGALVGGGTGLVDKSDMLSGKPLVKTAVKGAAIGTGVSLLSRKSAVKGAAIGAAAGTGWHFLQQVINKEDTPNYNMYSPY